MIKRLIITVQNCLDVVSIAYRINVNESLNASRLFLPVVVLGVAL